MTISYQEQQEMIEEISRLTEELNEQTGARFCVICNQTALDIWESASREKYQIHYFCAPKEGSKCLHETCPKCGGTGIDQLGNVCVHAISCPCPKCSPYSMVSS